MPLLLELYVFTLGVALDPGDALRAPPRHRPGVGARSLQLLFYASPIIYPIGFLPPWARTIAFLNPFTQVLQDIRAIVLYQDFPENRITAADAFGDYGGRLLPIAIARRHLLVVGLSLFRREEPWFAERV